MKGTSDPHNLLRFIKEQESIYDRVLSELKGGRKTSHWMWFIFPQFDGLGRSFTAEFYAIKSLEEARAYLQHPVLGSRLLACSGLLLDIENSDVSDIFYFPDDLKLRSSMTLFAAVSAPGSVFERVLDRYFEGERDPKTLELISG